MRSNEWGYSLLRADLVQGLDQQASDGDLRGFRMDTVFTQVCLLFNPLKYGHK